MNSQEADITATLDQLGHLRSAIGKAIVGQEEVIEQLLIGLLAWVVERSPDPAQGTR